jgi:hypothetical protein
MTRSRTFLSFILGSTMMTACAGITPDAAEAGDPVELAGKLPVDALDAVPQKQRQRRPGARAMFLKAPMAECRPSTRWISR